MSLLFCTDVNKPKAASEKDAAVLGCTQYKDTMLPALRRNVNCEVWNRQSWFQKSLYRTYSLDYCCTLTASVCEKSRVCLESRVCALESAAMLARSVGLQAQLSLELNANITMPTCYGCTAFQCHNTLNLPD